MVKFDHGYVRRAWVSSDGKQWRPLTFIENIRFVLTGALPYA
ncbi:hypothetical protein [Sphingomonas parapaucimobilis]|nr:hypothetical protein [Sphingomonas parapaucimobilis]